MTHLRSWLSRLAGFFSSPSDETDRAELAGHLEMEVAENVRLGMDPGSARTKALLDAGGMTLAMESMHERRGLPFLENTVADVRYAFRTLRHNPAYTLVAVATLGLGIGANTAIFSVVDAVLLRPLPYPASENLVSIVSYARGAEHAVSPPDFMDWRAQAKSFGGLVAAYESETILTGNGDPVRLIQNRVSANAFEVLGSQPLLGRAFRAGEDEPGSPRVALLGENAWRSRFGGDSGIVGRAILLDGRETTIVGIARSDLRWPRSADVWMTTRFAPEDVAASSRGAHWIQALGRVKPGVSVATARAEMTAIARRLAQQYPKYDSDYGVVVEPLLDHMVGDVRFQLMVLLSAVGFVLLIACANVASLTLARVASRNTELTVRKALGASAGRIMRQAVTESLVLAAIGGLAGTVVGAIGVRLLIALAPADLPRLYDIHMSGGVLAFTLCATVTTGLLFGVIPALNAGSANPGERLRGSRGATDRASALMRRTLVVTEVALAVVLMAGAGLLLRSFVHLLDVEPGFTAQGVTTFGVALPPAYGKPEQQRLYTSTLLDQLRTIPGVTAAGTSFSLPLTGDSFGFTFDISGRVTDPKNEPRAQARIANPGYFAAMGIPLLRGRMFDERDRAGATQSMIISAELARRYFPSENPIGKTLTTGWGGGPGLRFQGVVIGIVGDVRQFALNEPVAAHMYMSSEQWPLNEYNVVVRSSTPTSQLLPAIQQAIRRLDANVPIIAPRSLAEVVDASIGRPRFVLTLLGIFAVVAVLLAAVGLYGLIAYGVHARRREIGIRLALGATHRRVATMVLGEGVRLVAIGAVIGIAGAVMLTRLLQALLFEVGARDPLTITAAPLILMGVAVVACVIPARQAASLDPVETMRTD